MLYIYYRTKFSVLWTLVNALTPARDNAYDCMGALTPRPRETYTPPVTDNGPSLWGIWVPRIITIFALVVLALRVWMKYF